MYKLGDEFSAITVPAGTNLLISGPPMTGKSALALRILAYGTSQGEGAIIVTTKDSGEKKATTYLDLVGDTADVPFGVVDCVTKQQGMGHVQASERIAYASSPVDMTGIGIKLSEFLQEFYGDRRVHQNRILLDSLSTLLMYSNLQTVFRFLHVFTGRIQSADALGVFIIDATAHDRKTMSTLKQLFDGQFEIREHGAEGHQFRISGLRDVSQEWQPLDLTD